MLSNDHENYDTNDLTNLLENALSNENNSKFLNLTINDINNTKTNIITNLFNNIKIKNNISKQLNNYIFVDDVNDVTPGHYIRWININNEELKLTKGAIVKDYIIKDDGIYILCCNHGRKFFI